MNAPTLVETPEVTEKVILSNYEKLSGKEIINTEWDTLKCFTLQGLELAVGYQLFQICFPSNTNTSPTLRLSQSDVQFKQPKNISEKEFKEKAKRVIDKSLICRQHGNEFLFTCHSEDWIQYSDNISLFNQVVADKFKKLNNQIVTEANRILQELDNPENIEK